MAACQPMGERTREDGNGRGDLRQSGMPATPLEGGHPGRSVGLSSSAAASLDPSTLLSRGSAWAQPARLSLEKLGGEGVPRRPSRFSPSWRLPAVQTPLIHNVPVARFSDEAVVLDSFPYRDRHLVVALLTREHGLVRGVLRGARGGKTPRASATQLLSRVHVTTYQGPGAELATFDRVELQRPSFALAETVERSSAAAAVSELLLAFCPPGEPSEVHFRLADSAAAALLGGSPPATALAYVQLWVLTLGGVFPPLQECASCGRSLGGDVRVVPTDGQPRCSSCAPPAARSLDPDAVAFLVACRRRPLGEVTELPPPVVRWWLDLLVRLEAHRPLRALDLYHQLANGNGEAGTR